MTREDRIIALAQAVGADIKDLRLKQGDLTALTTTAKNNLVSAINEINAFLASDTEINDTAGDGNTTATWSANKIYDTIEAAKVEVKNSILNGAGSAFDTLVEIQALFNNDPNFATTLATDLSKRVRFDAAQVLSVGEKLQACTNIGVGDPDQYFVTDYNTAKT